MVAERFSPREFLRARHPQRFSDSVVDEKPMLDRSLLEYHLDTLTNRSQEVQFEDFARRLAEREICPNLVPQTGPTGGGDSKADSETYPVADQIALGWYIGIGREAASERWAFAFSAKKKWQEKVRSDIAKIVTTGRGYQKIFFVSNQFIRAQARAKVEDDLRAKHGLDVRILDRTWILDKVFGNGHEALAIECLGLTTSIRREIRKGPLDIQRERELEESEARIQAALQQQRFGLQLVDDCIHAALLSRGLDQPRTTITGRFDRAERMALKYGTGHQHFECAYQMAWTAFWWHEDYEQFAELYGTVEERARGSRNAYDLERLTNLWLLLHGAVGGHRLDEEKGAIEARTDTLTKELKRLSEEKDRPSTTLQAQTLLLMINLHKRLATQKPLDSILRDLQGMVRQGEGLVGYPLEPLTESLTELGTVVDGVKAYEELFETMVEVTSAREGEVAAARMLLMRGEQQLDIDRPYEAIRSLGRAFIGLYKHESRYNAVHALYLCGCAYERVGLLWAGRGTMLRAASLATDELWRYGKVTPLQAACYGRLKWLELQLGRLPHILAWHEVDCVIRNILADQRYDTTRLAEGAQAFDLILGILLLKTDFWELKRLSTVPDVLERLGLPGASTALMYALGYEEELRDEGFRQAWGEEDLHAIFLKWHNQPALEDLPERPSLYESTKVTLISTILGCQITAESANASPCVELAESVLAALESVLSTGPVERMVAREPTLTITVRKSDFARPPFDFELQDHAGRPHITIARWAKDLLADIRLPAPRFVQPEDVAFSSLGLARLPGLDSTEREVRGVAACTQFLNKLVEALWQRIRTTLQEINRNSIIVRAMENLEALDRDRNQWQRTAQAVLAIHQNHQDVVEVAMRRDMDRNQAGIVYRVLTEMAVCTCPVTGGRIISDTDLDSLSVYSSALIDSANQSDAIHYELIEPRIILSPSGDVRTDRDFSRRVIEPYTRGFFSEQFRNAADRYMRLFEEPLNYDDSTSPEELIDAELVYAFREEYGFSFNEFVYGIVTIGQFAVERQEAVLRCRESEIRNYLVARGVMSQGAAQRFMARFTLPRRSRWDEREPDGFLAKDWEPWRFSRRLSLMARPFVPVDDMADTTLVFGAAFLDLVASHLIDRLTNGHLPQEFFSSDAMRSWLGGVSDRLGHNFNETVAGWFRERGFQARSCVNMTEFGAPEQMGDVDVLAWNPTDGNVFVIECKRLQFARTIGEIGEQLRKFKGEARDELAKHLVRSQWLLGHPDCVRQCIHLTHQDLIMVPFLVTNTFVPMQFVDGLPLPNSQIVPFSGLKFLIRSRG